MHLYMYLPVPVLGVEVLVGVFSSGLNPWNPALKLGFGEPVGVVESGFAPKTGLFPPAVKLVKPDIPCPNVWGEKDRGLVVAAPDKPMTGAVDEGGGFLSAMKII